ncbi:MAG TPA: hypothetical protein VF062_09965 [Candidatus Limnocylindrales bacterium]
MALSPDAAGALIGELTRRIEALQAATYAGRDPAGLAEVKVDGAGLVCEVTLSRSIARHRPDAVASAIREAVTAAQLSLAEAFEGLAREAEGWES